MDCSSPVTVTRTDKVVVVVVAVVVVVVVVKISEAFLEGP
jgi:hypothetical protein